LQIQDAACPTDRKAFFLFHCSAIDYTATLDKSLGERWALLEDKIYKVSYIYFISDGNVWHPVVSMPIYQLYKKMHVLPLTQKNLDNIVEEFRDTKQSGLRISRYRATFNLTKADRREIRKLIQNFVSEMYQGIT
jgi:hypothetical protein